jgi:RNA polymerase sigma-B factor
LEAYSQVSTLNPTSGDGPHLSARTTDELEVEAAVNQWLATREVWARDELCRLHDALCIKVARRFRDRGEVLDDLTQVARIGMLKAVERFDKSFGVPFGAYATVTMVGELRRHFRDATWQLRVPRRIKDLQTTLRAAIDELTQELGRPPQIDEIAGRIGISSEQVLEALDGANAYRTDSLDAPSRGNGVSLLDRILSDEPSTDSQVELADLISRLPERDRQIIELRFFDGWSQGEIADHVGISQVHVSRLLRSILDSLRASLVSGDA